MDLTQLWTLTDGHAGNRAQASALASAIGGTVACEWTLEPRAPWRWIAPRMVIGARHAFGPRFRQSLLQPPGLAIGCGRQAALATRLLRQRGATTVQILDPRIDPRHWDLVIAPQHDGLEGSNVITLLGSLNPVDDPWLDAARVQFVHFSGLPQPRTAVLLGGTSAHARFDRGAFERLTSNLEVALARDGGSVLVTASRRTPADLIALLRHRFVEAPGVVWCGPEDGDNPYAGILAWADRIVVTPDSVNMVSEACATRAPIFVFDPACVSGRPRRFLEALLHSGRIRVMDSVLAAFEVQPLRETARVARLVHERLGIVGPLGQPWPNSVGT